MASELLAWERTTVLPQAEPDDATEPDDRSAEPDDGSDEPSTGADGSEPRSFGELYDGVETAFVLANGGDASTSRRPIRRAGQPTWAT